MDQGWDIPQSGSGAGDYDEWAAMAGIPNNEEMRVFGIKKSDYEHKLETYLKNIPHGLVATTTMHIERSIDEPLEIPPITSIRGITAMRASIIVRMRRAEMTTMNRIMITFRLRWTSILRS